MMAETTKSSTTMREHWQDALALMQRSYPAAALDLQRLTPVAYKSGTLTVAAPDCRTRDTGLRLRRVIGQYLAATAGRDLAIEYVLQDGGAPC